MDKSTISGLLLALFGISAGLVMEGGRIAQLLQPTAALIVLGGTVGAVMVQFPLALVMNSARELSAVFFVRHEKSALLRIEELVNYATIARRHGVVALDSEVNNIQDTFTRRALMLAVDGTEPQELRKLVTLELDNCAEQEENIPRVFEAAGGFAPTIGIIGAVLGLIQVMQHLGNIEAIGKGIAVAFVATVYGVGLANLFLLPAAGKLKIRIRERQILREMMLEGVASILEGTNPRMLETKLLGYLGEKQRGKRRET